MKVCVPVRIGGVCVSGLDGHQLYNIIGEIDGVDARLPYVKFAKYPDLSPRKLFEACVEKVTLIETFELPIAEFREPRKTHSRYGYYGPRMYRIIAESPEQMERVCGFRPSRRRPG